MDIEKKDLNIKPNLNSKVKINDYSNNSALMINQNFISIDSDNKEYVYKIYNKDKKTYVSKNIIITGKNDGTNVEVISGLISGDRVVSEGIRKLVDNARVKIIN